MVLIMRCPLGVRLYLLLYCIGVQFSSSSLFCLSHWYLRDERATGEVGAVKLSVSLGLPSVRVIAGRVSKAGSGGAVRV